MTKRMKVNSRDLLPNPYRDMKNYPINREKVEQLKASITETGFWDNILSRTNGDGKIQIAYGHHRLLALQELYPKGCAIEIPVKDLSDSLMIRIMANENMDDWKLSPGVIDETILATKIFLEKHPEEIKTKKPKKLLSGGKAGEIGYWLTPLAFQISEFLGTGWNEKRVYKALNRLQATGQIPDERRPKIVKDVATGEKVEKKRVNVDKNAAHSMPSGTAADNFVDVVEDFDLTIPQQKKVAKEIFESGIVGKEAMKSAAHSIKYPSKPTPKKKTKNSLPTDFDQFLADLAGDVRKVTKGLENLSKVMHEHGSIVVDRMTAIQITTAMETMYYKAGNILKKSKIIN